MPKMKSRRRTRGADAQLRLTQAAARNHADAAAVSDQEPVRGVKLKTVSTWTMVFALACLGAFAAGRPPISAAGPFTAAGKEQNSVRERRGRSHGLAASARFPHHVAYEARGVTGR